MQQASRMAATTRWLARLRYRPGVIAFFFLLPFMVLFIVFTAGPVLAALVMSFTAFDGLTPAKWVGLANYQSVLFGKEAATKLFWQSLVNTLYYTVAQVGLEMITGLALAMLVNAKVLKAKSAWRVLFYVPVVTSAVVTSMIWLWLYNPQSGLLNMILQGLGLPRLSWLSDPKLAMPAIILMMVWQGAGWSMVIYLAGLQGIPESLYEAARIDGASARQQFFYLTLPLLMPVTLFVVIIGCISSLQMFSPVYVMTQGGPLNATVTVTYQMWQNAFRFFRLGYASAMSFLLFLVILAISVLNNRVFGGRIEY
jgi:multiple sugar transport system permease protein